MVRNIVFFLTCLHAASAVQAGPVERKLAIEVIIDDSGTLTEPEKAQAFKLQLFAHLQNLRKKRRYASARIEVISTAYGRSVWIGTPRDLKGSRASTLVPKIEAHADYCNNLPGAFSELETSLADLEQRGYEEIWVIVFSSLIDTPRPCRDNMSIELPQLPPPLDFARILTQSPAVRKIAFYWVNPFQKRPWFETLEPVRGWAGARGTSFSLYDIENSIYELKNGLLEVRR